MTSYTITFNEGTADEVVLTESSNKVTNIKISAREESFIKNAEIIFNDTGSDWQKITVGDPIKIEINSTVVFSGTVNIKRRKWIGAKKIYIQAIGNTAKLWKYRTDRHKVYEDQYTSDIVKDLISTYCSGITTNNTPSGVGTQIEKIEFDALAVGDAIKKLTEFDNYYFFVDENDDLHYYQPSNTSQFTLNESDILSISWIEENLSNLVNDGIVFGIKVFENETIYDEGTTTYKLDSSSKRIAARFKAESDILSGIKAYVNRTTGANTPGYLHADIKTDSTSNLPDSLVSDIAIWDAGKIASPPGWLPYFEWNKDNGELSVTENDYYWVIFRSGDVSSSKYWSLYYDDVIGGDFVATFTDDLSSDPTITQSTDFSDFGTVNYNSTEDRIDFDVTFKGMNKESDAEFSEDTRSYTTEFAFQFDVNLSTYDDLTDDLDSVNNGSGFWVLCYSSPFYDYWGVQFNIDDTTSLETKVRGGIDNAYSPTTTPWHSISTSTTYTMKIVIKDGSFKFYVNDDLVGSFSYTINSYIRPNKVRLLCRDGNRSSTADCVQIAGWIDNIRFDTYFVDDHILTSEDGGSTWIRRNARLRYGLGWNKDYITATASDSTSQSNYGKQFRRFPATGYYNFIKTQADAQAFIDAIIEAFKNPLDRATLRIEGNENITLKQKFTLNIPSLGINSELWKISGYTHEITPSGFFTTLYAGEMPFDLAQEIRRLQIEARE